MTYRDKSSNRMVTLTPSRTDFLVVATPAEDAEGIHPTLNQKVFSVVRSTNQDRVYVLRARTESESATEIQRQVTLLAQDPQIETVTPGLVDAAGTTKFALPDRVMIKFKSGAASNRGAVTQLGARVLREFRTPGLMEVEVPAGTAVDGFIDRLNGLSQVVFAEPSYYAVDDREVRFRVNVRAGSTAWSEAESLAASLPWNLEKLEVSAAWTQTRGLANVVVAVMDGLPEVGHEALAGKFLGPMDDSLFFSQDRSVSSHATNICGTLAGESDRVMGVAPGIRLLPLIVNLNSQVYAERADALHAAAEFGKKGRWNGTSFSRMVLSCSWRTGGDIAVIRTALEEVVRAGILAVFSAGNDDSSAPHFPSDYGTWAGVLSDSVLCVAATNRQDQRAPYSNYSAAVSVCAPGGDGLPLDERDILCPDQGESYAFAAGTSIAAPHVAGVAALILSSAPDLTVKELKQLILDSTDDISLSNPSYAHTLGRGRINARKAVQAAGALAGLAVDAPAGPPPAAEAPRAPAAASGPTFHVESAVSTAAVNRMRDLLARCSGELEVATGWSLSQATLTDGAASITVQLT